MLRRGQSAVEYLTIVTLSLLILVPTSYYVLSYANDLQARTEARQLGVVGEQITTTIDEVYASQTGSFIRLDLQLPETTKNVTVRDSKEIVFSLQTRLGETDLVFFSDNVNITNGTSCSPRCGLPLGPGQNTVKLENHGTNVSITS